MFRRWVEVVLILQAGGMIWYGLHLPPPVAPERTVVGKVTHVEKKGRDVEFRIDDLSFASYRMEPGTDKLLTHLEEGVQG